MLLLELPQGVFNWWVRMSGNCFSLDYTPGRGKIVPKNYWAQWRTWRDSDYTVTIVISYQKVDETHLCDGVYMNAFVLSDGHFCWVFFLPHS